MTGFLLTAKQKLMLCINKRLYGAHRSDRADGAHGTDRRYRGDRTHRTDGSDGTDRRHRPHG